MGNGTIEIKLDLIPGACNRFLTDDYGNTREYVCIPVDNARGSVVTERIDGWNRSTATEHWYLNLDYVAVREPKYGTHVLLLGMNKETLQHMDEAALKRRPILGNIKPWEFIKGKRNDGTK